MINKIKTELSYLYKRPLVLKYYYLHKKFKTRKKEIGYQDKNLRKIIRYSYNNIPYYKELFDSLNLKPSDIKTKEDLKKLPVLTKATIKKNITKFYPNNKYSKKYMNGSTGGSTGAPLKYRVSEESYSMGVALLYRGWSRANYKLGDRVAIIAGGSLVSKENSLKKRLQDYLLNFRHYSSYGMDDELILSYAEDMIKWKPKFIRGYATSVFKLAIIVKKNNLENKFKLKAIFTTAEMLSQKHREVITNVFGVEVYDQYGLNDGGVSAYECKYHNMHIDVERAILESVDKNGKNIFNEDGKILATTLIDKAMPLIRYETGDLGVITEEFCRCGSESLLLKELKGRVTDTLIINGKTIGSPVLTVLLGKVDIIQYQIVQVKNNKIIIKIQKSETYSTKDEDFLRNSLFFQVGEFDLQFEYVDEFITTRNNKHKFIIKL